MVISRPAAILMALVPVVLVAALAVMASGGSSGGRAAALTPVPSARFDADAYAALKQFVAVDRGLRHMTVRELRASCARIAPGARDAVASGFHQLCNATVSADLASLRLSVCRGGGRAACSAALRTYGARIREHAELRQSVEDGLAPGPCLTALHTARAATEARLADASEQLAIAVAGAATLDDVAGARDAFLANVQATQRLPDPWRSATSAARLLSACRPEAA